jgi:hypothetical protein
MRRRVFFALAVGTALGSACATGLGPKTLRTERPDYNRQLLASHNAEMLLNLVRLRYNEPPLFLQVGSVVTNYKYEAGVSAGGGVGSGNGGSSGTFGGNLDYREQPTITYSPLIGEDFAQRMLTPLPVESIMLFEQSGWSAYQLMLVGVQQINEVYNAPSSNGPTPRTEPDFATFLDLAERLERLRNAGMIGFNWEFPSAGKGPADRDRHAKSSTSPKPSTSNPKQSTWSEANPPPGGLPRIWVRAPVDPDDPLAADVAAVRRLLDLPADRDDYVLDGFPFGRRRDHVGIRCRSLLGIMFFLSQAIEVPPEHVAAGLVTVTKAKDGRPFDWRVLTDRILRVHSRKTEPPNAFVAVKDHGWWFWIAEDDPDSKATFALLDILYSLQQATGRGKMPVLTLPVGD